MIEVRIAPAVLLLALAACQQAPHTETANAVDAAAPADVVTLPPDESAVPPPTASSNDSGGSDTETTVIPAAFHGRWGMVAADCTSTRGDAKGLMTIAADSIRFYESVARPAVLTLVGDRRIDGNYAATGEGQTWTLLQQLMLSNDGKTLTRVIDEGDSAPRLGGNRFTYTRCA